MSGGVGAGARGGFNPLRGATTGVVIRRRATSGEMARGFWFFLGGAVAVCFEGCCGGGNAKRSFAGRIPKRSLGTTQRGRGAVAVCFEGCCGSMCWPVDRPATHAAAGAAARGALIFCFGDCFTRPGVDGTRGLGVGGLIRCAGRPREWSCGAVPPQERWHEGGWFLFFLWRLLRCRRGILSHALERPFGAVTPLERRDEDSFKEFWFFESCEGEVVAARDWHGACLPGSAFWK